jgi:hypothetical protein
MKMSRRRRTSAYRNVNYQMLHEDGNEFVDAQVGVWLC